MAAGGLTAHRLPETYSEPDQIAAKPCSEQTTCLSADDRSIVTPTNAYAKLNRTVRKVR